MGLFRFESSGRLQVAPPPSVLLSRAPARGKADQLLRRSLNASNETARKCADRDIPSHDAA
ncbi:hypothetical protein AKJ09_03570 [Labilithrix luteola]|uniref:Uncharacterized protein n=1 Tax=Labilithrix luteola TaxID=1391654 RepID=A0A0K1PU63_9BACT|nr:hypothetical protein AKJ09_03570 [Labilithrix luteola]